MKKLILVCSVMLALVATSFAQNAQSNTDPIEQKQKGKDKMNRKHKNKGAHAAKELGLNDEQKTKMKGMSTEFHGKMQAIKTDQSLTKEQKRTQAKELAKAHDAQVKEALTPEQYTKLSEMKKNRMAEGKTHRGKGGKGIKKDDVPAPQKN